MYNPTCFFTGEKSNLKMHPLRNENGDMVGWIFVQNAIDLKDSEINHTYKITEAAQKAISMIKAMQPEKEGPSKPE